MTRFVFISVLVFFSNLLVLEAQTFQGDSLQIVLKNYSKEDTTKVNLLLKIAHSYKSHDTNSFSYAQKSLELAQKLDFKVGKAKSLTRIAYYYYYKSDYVQFIEHIEKALEIAKELDDKPAIANCLIGIGIAYYLEGNYSEALAYYQKALEMYEVLGDEKKISMCFTNIGTIHDVQDNNDKALRYYQEGLKIDRRIGSIEDLLASLTNIGGIYTEKEELDKALEYFEEGLEMAKKAKYKKGSFYCFEGIGNIYQKKKDYRNSLKYYKKALKGYQKVGDKQNFSVVYSLLATLYLETKDYQKALINAKKSLEIAEELKLLEQRKDAHEILSKIYALTNDYQNAYTNHLKHKMLNDSLFNKNNIKEITALEHQYKHDKEKQAMTLGHQQEIALHKLEIEEHNIIRNILIGGVLIMLLLVVIAVYEYVQKQKANKILAQQKLAVENTNGALNQINEELNTLIETVNLQKTALEKSHQETHASITYASKIQKALFPTHKVFSNFFSEYFIFYKPKDIVSGDFYYLKKIDNLIVIAVGDCTGHGVPGAFVSLLGIAFLNEIVVKKEIKTAAEVLEELRKQVKNSLKQTNQDSQSKDGMDIALCIIDTKTNLLQFAGAHNPLYMIRNNELMVIKGTSNPIGIHLKEKSFENHEIQIQKSDNIYLFSDGYVDQFGGADDRKYMTKRFKKILLEIVDKPFDKQKEILEVEFENWKGDGKQIDDVALIGIKI